jgi:hypothetical protein
VVRSENFEGQEDSRRVRLISAEEVEAGESSTVLSTRCFARDLRDLVNDGLCDRAMTRRAIARTNRVAAILRRQKTARQFETKASDRQTG